MSQEQTGGMLKVAIIGMGKLGGSIAKLLHQKDVKTYPLRRNDPLVDADLYYLTVPDKSLLEVANKIPIGKIILHASGANDHLLLRPHYPVGVLHPIMTFPGIDVGIPSPPIPAGIRGDPEAIQQAKSLCQLLGFQAFEFNGDASIYHSAAVIAGNFSTILMHIAADLLASQGIPKDHAMQYVMPLAIESVKNAAKGSLKETLSGPLARQDHVTIEKHLESFKGFPKHIERAYSSMTQVGSMYLAWEKRKIKQKKY